jgi:hypothetical protein
MLQILKQFFRQAIANMYKLLKDGGTVLMGFLASAPPLYDIYEKLSKFKVYEKYMEDVNNFISPYHYLKDPINQFKIYLDETGFQIKHLELRDQVYIYDSVDQLKSKFSFINFRFCKFSSYRRYVICEPIHE